MKSSNVTPFFQGGKEDTAEVINLVLKNRILIVFKNLKTENRAHFCSIVVLYDIKIMH